MSYKYKRTITIDVENNEDGTYDAYISTGVCSGDRYSKISSNKIGENITDLIECLYEEDMPKKLVVNGETIVLSDEVISQLHRQERIEEGKRIAKKFVSKRVYNKMADADFEKVTLRDFILKLKIKDLNKACESLQAKDVNLNDVTFTKESMPEYRIFCENSRYFKRKILVWKTDKVHGHFHGIAYMVCNEQYRRITYGCHSWNDDEEKSMRKFIWPFVSTLSYQELTGTEDEIKHVCELIKQYVKYNELEKLQFDVF